MTHTHHESSNAVCWIRTCMYYDVFLLIVRLNLHCITCKMYEVIYMKIGVRLGLLIIGRRKFVCRVFNEANWEALHSAWNDSCHTHDVHSKVGLQGTESSFAAQRHWSYLVSTCLDRVSTHIQHYARTLDFTKFAKLCSSFKLLSSSMIYSVSLQ